MARRKRHDQAGCLHHVMNRGIARRSLFEGRADVRRFLGLISCRVRAKRLELHAYAFMLTHFHLVVRSLDGQLSENMRVIQNSYVRHFNRTRRRDGPLVRGRFLSVPIRSMTHAVTVIRYVDQNPVTARISGQASDYPFGSARHHRSRLNLRRGLTSSLVNNLLTMHTPADMPRAQAYDALFQPRLTPEQRAWVEARLRAPKRAHDELDDLLASTTHGVRAWAIEKAQLADGTDPGLPLVDAGTADACVAEAAGAMGPWRIRAAGYRTKDGWDVLKTAILKDLAGETFASVARRLARSHAFARKLYSVHVLCLRSDPEYSKRFERVTQTALKRLHGGVKW
jgi:REP element-mobilizing transposase RayT